MRLEHGAMSSPLARYGEAGFTRILPWVQVAKCSIFSMVLPTVVRSPLTSPSGGHNLAEHLPGALPAVVEV